MYKIIDRYKNIVTRYSFAKLDINGIYSKDTWLKAGFKESILEEC
jgi:hypothetical protein